MSLTPKSQAQLEHLKQGLPPPANAGVFGASIPINEAALVLLATPWEATVSYGAGAAEGPKKILQASHQLDVFDPDFGFATDFGIHFDFSLAKKIKALNTQAKLSAQKVIKALESNPEKIPANALKKVNEAGEKINQWIFSRSLELLKNNKFIGLVGGDHSCPLGFYQAINQHFSGDFGILHIDAHMDLRKAYEGFTYSHASIMYNILETCHHVSRLVGVGVRDFSREEFLRVQSSNQRVVALSDEQIQNHLLSGRSFAQIVQDIISCLPKNVAISFDIDGLDPALCPATGTPVAGGLSFAQARYLIKEVAKKRKIIAVDLTEVVPNKIYGEWNENVGARILYLLCGALLHSQYGAKP